MTSLNNLTNEILKQLKTYTTEVREKMEEAQQETANHLVSQLKIDSPERRPAYSKGWKITKEKNKLIVHNKEHQLTHLLEHGHAKRGGGRVEPQIHIRPLEEEAMRSYLDKIEGILEE